MITLGTVNISNKTKALMQEALDRGIIGQGEYIQEFEKKLADFLGVKHVIAVANGTLADACALAVVKFKDDTERDEIIVPALTFISQINAVYYNHLKPVFVDVGHDYQINTEKIAEKITKKTLAIMPTHLLGRPVRMEKIISLAEKYNLFVVEDACEALGSRYKNKFCGTIANMGCFSFFVSHSITTGEGGAIATNDDVLADLCRSLRNHGRKNDSPEEKFIFPRIGFSAKMNTMEAIIGLGTMNELPQYIERRHQNMVQLNTLLEKDWFSDQEDEYIVPHSFPILVKSREERDRLLRILPEKFGIEARQIFYSIPTQSEAYRFLGEKEGSYPVAEDIGQRGLYFPCHQNLDEQDIRKIANVILQLF
ncbi:MAG TPA: DegT/DnrJ/EryC1/StrS family aminotransferase [bacterium]|nr:DegT/DnrJ/EryC1/StrS family aminotransferase [bacterium]